MLGGQSTTICLGVGSGVSGDDDVLRKMPELAKKAGSGIFVHFCGIDLGSLQFLYGKSVKNMMLKKNR